MPPATRFLQTSSGEEEPLEPISVDSDVVVILAALLCALICLVGLALVARCAWLRRAPAPAAGASPAPLANKGLKKKDLRALPKVSYAAAGDAAGGKLSAECAICLAEFEEGDEVRVLPQCGHGFHVGCVDTWLGSHASCPSCRSVLVVVPMPAPTPLPPPLRCHRCGARSCEIDEVEAEGDANRFLP